MFNGKWPRDKHKRPKTKRKEVNKTRPPDDLNVNIIKHRHYRSKGGITKITNLIDGFNSKIIKSKGANQ